MATNPLLMKLINQYAPKYGVDPGAAARVASVEGGGGFGAVGDQGTSFGPWQLHAGGALPVPVGQGAKFANSPAGVEYAIRQMGGVARGLRGPAAVAAIVRGFERPANPNAEIARALGQNVSTAVGQMRAQGSTQVSQPAPGAHRRLAMAFINHFGETTPQSTEALLGAIMHFRNQSVQQQHQGPNPMSDNTLGGGGKAGVPAMGKIIGSPYQGTHAKQFNVSGGSDNWESENAVDVSLPYGTPVRAVTSGVIGNQFGSLGTGGRMAGLRAHLVAPNNEYYYAHLSRFAPGIKPGARVQAGQIIGFSGAANGVNHLHFAENSGNPMSLYQATH